MENRVHNSKFFQDARKDLRNNSTREEIILWNNLKQSKLGLKFRRQHGIGKYIVDFYCPKAKLAIEIDGFQHVENKEYDLERTNYLNTLGIKVLRFWNLEVNSNIEDVLGKVRRQAKPAG